MPPTNTRGSPPHGNDIGTTLKDESELSALEYDILSSECPWSIIQLDVLKCLVLGQNVGSLLDGDSLSRRRDVDAEVPIKPSSSVVTCEKGAVSNFMC